ncbi:hypothetical protein K2Z83_04565 [Oscillochloris sp. ZM17-4]|uniref:hypothetical protein n=1 Tax=Oscillochloris sp. ZM17-4 TaxID=2866714 RepID=UPI001C72DCBF|nr:hypothetical protein [Oscillochloris sp. ZM17-4]MBX0326954.1 hypothetical protein [Oscillochloris sp. ZM17-4]
MKTSDATAQAATRAMDTIQRCVDILHDLAAANPAAATATIDALRCYDTPAAEALAWHIERVAEARHGAAQLRRAR